MGRTNVRAARAAWEANVAAEFGITDDLDATERARRLDAALRVRMARLSRARWSKKSATNPEKRRGAQEELTNADGQPPRRAA